MKVLYFITILILVIPISVFAQAQPIKIPLKIVNGESSVLHSIVKVGFDEKESTGKTTTNLLVKALRSPNKPEAFSIFIDKNNNGNLLDETPIIITDGNRQPISLSIKNKFGKSITRTFEIIHEQDEERKTDYISITPTYLARGLFNYKGCKIPISIFDGNSDGLFSFEENSSNIGIDTNKDGKIWGRSEWAFATEIIELCGKNYLISNLANDGSSLTFSETPLQNVKLYNQSPEFNFVLVNGKPLSSENFKGKPYLIDFWATWCGICIEKMPEIKQLEGTLPIIYFNTDLVDRKKEAFSLINKLQISENSVLRISPKADNFYKSYQRLEFGLPFYVLIDSKGIIRYGGTGGDDLKDLKAKIEELKNQK